MIEDLPLIGNGAVKRGYFTNLILRYLIHLKPVNSVVSFMLASFFGPVQLGRSVYMAYD